ncbi:hypothetical protein FAGAP_1327 [Fusarium agapanthi]|uniref:Uncharacterized protein n=1 Tax=Fusarium agapanthi TaxID=1803897 RepID=A0A9P5BPB5_9HYPO|nr:hypothetical protein FAGAP_1327 [Fusarium agapanthi]
MPIPIQENKSNLIATTKNIKQEDLINMSADAATIEACYTLIAMSRGTNETKQHCQTSGCNKSHQYSTRSKARNNED